MKTIFTAILLVFLSNNLVAQTVFLDGIMINQIPKSKLLYETEKGLVYALPQDNMKCLVPKIQSNMPIASTEIPGYIPNPLLKKGQSPIKVIPLNISPLPLSKDYQFLKSETINLFSGKK